MNIELLFRTWRNTTGAAVYIFVVSQIMQNANTLFGAKDNMFTPFVVLLLFSLSAAVVGGLVFGQSIMLFFESKRSESIKAAIFSIGWLGFYTVVGMLILLVAK